MAAKCPKCGRALKWYNFKAECPDCGVSIPNYNWESRLEEDNKKAEEKFAKFYNTLNHLKYTVWGTKLRIARLVMSFIPALGFILPWAKLESEGDKLYFDLIGIFTDGKSTIDFFPILIKNIGDIFGGLTSSPYMYVMLGLALMLLSIVIIVIAFFVTFIKFRKFSTKATWITDAISIVFAIAAAVMFALSSSQTAAQSFAIGELNFTNASSGLMWGVIVYIALLFVALIGNILVSNAPVKTAEELENERLEKVRIKEEKEEQARIRKEAERAEAKKKAEEEQAEKVRKAREALAKKNK